MEQPGAPSITKIATKYGLIQGVLAFIVFIAGTLAAVQRNWVASTVDTALLVVLMVLAHREYKSTHEGKMTYPQGLGSGTLLATVAAVISCILVYIYVKFINTGYLAALLKVQQAALEQRGMTAAQAQQAMAITSAIMTPVGLVVTSLITGVIVGFIVALIVSIFTQKANPRAVV